MLATAAGCLECLVTVGWVTGRPSTVTSVTDDLLDRYPPPHRLQMIYWTWKRVPAATNVVLVVLVVGILVIRFSTY